MLPWRRALFGGVAIMGGGGAKTYADLQAHFATLTANVRTWQTDGITSAGAYRTTANSSDLTGASLAGSPWLSFVRKALGSAPARRAQHALPSQAVFDAQIAGGFESYYLFEEAGTQNCPPLNRNGFLSADGVNGDSIRCTKAIWWDGAQALYNDPSTGTGPTPYAF